MTDTVRTVEEAAALYAETKITDRAELGKEFALVLGIETRIPASTWRPLGDPEVITACVQATCAWLDQVNIRAGRIPQMPSIPEEEHRRRDEAGNVTETTVGPANGAREVFDVAMRAWLGGFTPAQIQSEWTTQHRRYEMARRGAPGFKGLR
jgi:hypothetical protein